MLDVRQIEEEEKLDEHIRALRIFLINVDNHAYLQVAEFVVSSY